MYFICNVCIYMSPCHVGKKLIRAYVYCSLYARLKQNFFNLYFDCIMFWHVLLILFVIGLMTVFSPDSLLYLFGLT
jgi:hypothetical protein